LKDTDDMKKNDTDKKISVGAFAKLIIALVIVTAVLSAFGYAHFDGPKVIIFESSINSRSGNPIRVVYVMPDFDESWERRAAPAVVAIPPYSIPPEAMEIICIELARRGCACAIPDFFGKTPEESRQNMGRDSLDIMTLDVLTIVATLRANPYVNPKKIGVCGHSVGGTVTVLAGMRDRTIRSAVPIGMEADFEAKRPQNLLFISGLYDEIHHPKSLLENLTNNNVTDDPKLDKLYGSHSEGTARQVSVLPTTDHFIETFDPFLIRKLMEWYGASFGQPALGQGTLRSFWHRVSRLFLMLSIAILYGALFSKLSEKYTRTNVARKPGWMILRLQAVPVIIILAIVYWAGTSSEFFAPLAIDLMIVLLLAQESASHTARGVILHDGRSHFRSLRAALMIMIALGAATLISFGLTVIPDFVRFPWMLKWYPVFFVNMSTLFPVEVWGRVRPWFFKDIIDGVTPGTLYFALLFLVIVMPGALMRGTDRVAREMVNTVRSRLKPLHKIPDEIFEEDQTKTSIMDALSPLKIGLLVILLSILGFFVFKRIREGMLTPETGMLALISMLRFAVLPFIITALIVRTRKFRKWSLMD
jgi:Dienelactone hydrolase family